MEPTIWDGDYDKEFHYVHLPDGERVLCWPNAGSMYAVDGSGRFWTPEDKPLISIQPEEESRIPTIARAARERREASRAIVVVEDRDGRERLQECRAEPIVVGGAGSASALRTLLAIQQRYVDTVLFAIDEAAPFEPRQEELLQEIFGGTERQWSPEDKSLVSIRPEEESPVPSIAMANREERESTSVVCVGPSRLAGALAAMQPKELAPVFVGVDPGDPDHSVVTAFHATGEGLVVEHVSRVTRSSDAKPPRAAEAFGRLPGRNAGAHLLRERRRAKKERGKSAGKG